MYVHEAVAVERLRLSTAGGARRSLSAVSGKHGLAIMSKKWGGVEILLSLPQPRTVSAAVPAGVGQGAVAWRYVRC